MIEIEYIGKCLLINLDRKKILVVGDLHLGYEQALNESGVYIGRQMFKEMIDYFDKIFAKIGKVDEIILLGDVKHAFGDINNQEWNDVLGLFDYFDKYCRKIVIVKGNHDKIIDPIVSKRKGVENGDFYILDKFAFVHGNKDFEEIYDKKIKYWIMGHGHPAVKIREGVKIEKYKAFLIGNFKGREIIIVPSFLEANIGTEPRENNLYMAWDFNLEKFDVKIVSEDLEVLDFGKLKKLK